LDELREGVYDTEDEESGNIESGSEDQEPQTEGAEPETENAEPKTESTEPSQIPASSAQKTTKEEEVKRENAFN
jgi:hypothetical protein